MASLAPGSLHLRLAYRVRLRKERTHATVRRIDALSMEYHDYLANFFTSVCDSLSFSLHPIVLHALCDNCTFIRKVPEKHHCTAPQTFCYLSNPKRLFLPIEHLLNIFPT